MNINRLRSVLLVAIVLVAQAAGPRTVAARWVAAIDSRNVDQWLSVRGTSIYTVRDGHVVAIDTHSGVTRWASREMVESRPAIGGGTVYAPVTDGIVAFDTSTGAVVGRRALDTTPVLLTAGATAIALVETPGGPGERAHTVAYGFRDTLTSRWKRVLAPGWNNPADAGANVVLLANRTNVLALDAASGKAIAATDGVDTYVGRDGRVLWFSVAGGGIKGLDLDTNEAIAVHDRIVRGAVRVEGATAVAVIDGRLMRLTLPAGTTQPLPIDGRWVGGPARGMLFVSRQDGTYAVPLDGGKPVRLVTNTSDARFLTADGDRAFFLTNDGSIVAADLRSVRALVCWPAACSFVEGIHRIDGSALVHCDDVNHVSHVYAFDLQPD